MSIKELFDETRKQFQATDGSACFPEGVNSKVIRFDNVEDAILMLMAFPSDAKAIPLPHSYADKRGLLIVRNGHEIPNIE